MRKSEDLLQECFRLWRYTMEMSAVVMAVVPLLRPFLFVSAKYAGLDVTNPFPAGLGKIKSLPVGSGKSLPAGLGKINLCLQDMAE